MQVEIKHVDLRESLLCGYLRINGLSSFGLFGRFARLVTFVLMDVAGLTEDHPTLTTYFEGEIIGSKYSFLTQHENWGSTDIVDLAHWSKFPSWQPFEEPARHGNHHVQDFAQRDNIFMRWKEHFLVPDHRVRTITGASFEGFYFICFNQITGNVSGIYFHNKSEKYVSDNLVDH